MVCKYSDFVVVWCCFFKEKSTSLCLFFLSVALRQLISGAVEDLNGKPLTRKWGPSSSCLISVFILSQRPPVQESEEEAVISPSV